MRWKLLVGNIVAVLLVGVIAWALTQSRAAEALVTDIDPSVVRSVALLDAVRAQDADQLIDAVQAAAQSPDLLAALAAGSESEQREAGFTFAEGVSRQLVQTLPRRGRPAELVALLAADGRLVARNIERRQDAGRNLSQEFPAIANALQPPAGHVVRDFIKYGEQGWLEVAVVPVIRDGQIRGGLLVGFAVADSAARNDANRVGVDVGYLFREGDRYTVQSLSVGQQREKEQLRDWCNAPSTGIQNLFRGRQRVRITLGDAEYLAAVLPMPGAFTPENAGAVVLRSVTDARKPAGDVAFPALIAMAVGLLLVVGYNLYMANYLEKPIEQIEDGLLQVINGNRDHRINLEHPELGGIVYRINQLVSELTGAEEGDGN
jgi:HAMP domain-containing protein